METKETENNGIIQISEIIQYETLSFLNVAIKEKP